MAKKTFKSTLQEGNIGSLSPEELVQYFIYRLENLLKKRYVLSDIEIKYLLCETGNGALRFDPEIADSILSNKQKIPGIIRKKCGSFDIYYSEYFYELAKEPASVKKEIVKVINSQDTIDKVLDGLANHIKTLASEFGYSISDLCIKQKRIEFQISNINALIWFCPDLWLFPYSKELWQLVEKAQSNKAMPVIFSKKIHGVCFPLFKEFGIFGSNMYNTYLPDDIVDQIYDFNDMNWQTVSKIKLSPGNITYLSDNAQIESLLSNLFNKCKSSIPENLDNQAVSQLSSGSNSVQKKIEILNVLLQNLPNRKVKQHLSKWLGQRIDILSLVNDRDKLSKIK